MSELTNLCNKYKTDKGNKIFFENQDAPHEYSFIYEKFLNKEKIKSILEIGLFWRGGSRGVQDISLGARSLYVWRDYLPEANIYGFDLLDGSYLSKDKIKIYQGNQDSKEDLNKLTENILKDNGGQIDAIIDDGSHVFSHANKTFKLLFENLLKPKGFFFVEDMPPNSLEWFESIKQNHKEKISFSKRCFDATKRNDLYIYQKI